MVTGMREISAFMALPLTTDLGLENVFAGRQLAREVEAKARIARERNLAGRDYATEAVGHHVAALRGARLITSGAIEGSGLRTIS